MKKIFLSLLCVLSISNITANEESAIRQHLAKLAFKAVVPVLVIGQVADQLTGDTCPADATYAYKIFSEMGDCRRNMLGIYSGYVLTRIGYYAVKTVNELRNLR